MAGYWIKLFIEILDDPKMAKLPDRLWRRVIELFLVAGHTGGMEKNGKIPDLLSLAWLLRLPTDELELDMKQLETTGIIQRTLDGWIVTNFTKRQAAVPHKERTRQYRKRQQHNEYIGDDCVTKSPVEQNRVEKNRIDQNRSEAEVERDIFAATANANMLKKYGVAINDKTIGIAQRQDLTPSIIEAHAERLLREHRFTAGLLITCLQDGDPVKVTSDASRYTEWEQ